MARIYLERRDMTDELRRSFDGLDHGGKGADHLGDCQPPVDVVESPAAFAVTVDLPGVRPDAVDIAVARGTLLIAGTKRPEACQHHDATFHLAERAFGRFARIVRLTGAVDAGAARATLANGELRIVIPRIEERRGRELRVTIETA